jgi:hypothetical protein
VAPNSSRPSTSPRCSARRPAGLTSPLSPSAFGTPRSENTRSRVRDHGLRPHRASGHSNPQVTSGVNYDSSPKRLRATVFTQTDPLQGDPDKGYASAYAYVENRPTVMVDPSGLRGLLPEGFNPLAAGAGSNRSAVAGSVKDFVRGLVRSVPRGFFKTWGTCGSVSGEIPLLSIGYSGCLVDDGRDISTITTWEMPGGLGVLGGGLGAGEIISNARNADDMGGEGICLDFGIRLAVGAGAELCIGLRKPASQVDLTSVSDVRQAYSGVVSAYLYASAGAGITVGLRDTSSTVKVVWKYPSWIPHLLPKPLIPDFV